jgi:hypothetical protein
LTQGIHTYIPETNHVSRVYSVAVIPRVGETGFSWLHG